MFVTLRQHNEKHHGIGANNLSCQWCMSVWTTAPEGGPGLADQKTIERGALAHRTVTKLAVTPRNQRRQVLVDAKLEEALMELDRMSDQTNMPSIGTNWVETVENES